MKRITHTLRKNERETRPQYMVFFDTETIPRRTSKADTTQDFRLGVACYWRHRRDEKPDTREWLEYTDVGAFWDWVLGKSTAHTVLYMIAHNLAFDALVVRMFPELPRRGWRFLFQHESGHTRLFKWGMPTRELTAWLGEGKHIKDFEGKRWTKTILMMDNCNLFGGSIEDWGDDLKFPKLKRPPYDADNALWWPYCRRDVEIMVRLWEEWFPFLDEHHLGAFRTTIGSQAFGAFRHGYMHNKIEIHTDAEAIALERDAYLGGRTEPFFVGRVEGQDLYKLDVNSMYPYVMNVHWYPSRLAGIGLTITPDALRTLLDKYGVTARVLLTPTLPVFPVKQDGKNVYPVGEFVTTLSTPEIAYALDRGWVKEVHAYATYRTRPLFYWFTEALYALKVQYGEDNDPLRRNLVKLLLNSLYGKFGQLGYQDRIIGTADPEAISVSHGYDRARRCNLTIYTAGGLVIEQIRTGEGYNSFVAIAAHVTAYARLYLWSLIERAGRRNVYYCDTDSLIVTQAGYDALADGIDPVRLGFLKVEERGQSLEIRAPKDYDFAGHTVRKGIPGKAVEVDPDTFDVETWPGLISHLAGGNIDTFHNCHVTKTLTYGVDWGELQPDGWVTPYELGPRPLLF